jgi:hypothetical protein
MSDAAVSRHPGFPARALLRPGLRVVRRSATELQVGLSPGRSVVLPDDPAVRLLLRGLADGRAPAPPEHLSPAARRAADLLLTGDHVVDADLWTELLGDTDPAAARTRAALLAEAGSDTPRRLAARSAIRVQIEQAGLPEAAERLSALLFQAGIGAAPMGRHDVVVVCCEGEVPRPRLDALVQQETPHVLLVVAEGRVRVGPFVQPGHTACQRCIDAHHSEDDPRHALLIEQQSRPATPPWGLPPPVPGDLVDIAVGLVARDLCRWADVLRPATWSTTLTVDADLELPRRVWSRHAACGCSSNTAAG